jgi:hypothetical protein
MGVVLFGLIVLFAAEARPAQATSDNLILPVPFTSQAPTGEWKDQRQQDGCEEAAAAMAMAWVGSEKNIKPADWRLRILILSTFEKKKYGEYRDVALPDIVNWLFKDYFDYQSVEIKAVGSAADILHELEQGKIVLTPMNGRALKNPNFSGLGPERHMILIKGYDYRTKEFITNDPGTRRGENYRYSEKIIFNAIRPYQTGYHKPFGKLSREMIVVSPK